MIWKTDISLEKLNSTMTGLSALLDIKFTASDDISLTATMPVTPKVHQPFGILHGGASVVLAETVGSSASALVVDTNKFMVVGLEINANHLRPMTSGIVSAVCTAVHLGKKTHVWDIRLSNEQSKLVCISRLTVAVVAREAG